MGNLKQGPTTTTTTQNAATLPPHITEAQKYLMSIGQSLTLPQFLQGAPNFGVMGLTPDQTMASDLAQQAGMYGSQFLQNVPNVSIPSATAQQGTAAQAAAQQLAPGEVSPFMNPYIDAALNPVLERLKQQQAEVQSGIGAQAAASHMFGGSREAVMRMLADRNYRDTLGTTAGNMLHAGWQSASGLASQNADRRQQTALTNAQLQNSINALNAQLGTQAGIANAGFSLQGQGLQGQLQSQALNNQLNTSAMLNLLGGQQRAVGQQALDLPFQRLSQLLSVTPMAVPQSTTGSTSSTTSKPLDIASILSGGLGLFGAFSDRRLKENIKQVGELDNGLAVYAFNFVGNTLIHIGLMSDEVKKVHPEAVHQIHGFDMVDYSLAVR